MFFCRERSDRCSKFDEEAPSIDGKISAGNKRWINYSLSKETKYLRMDQVKFAEDGL